MYNKENVFAKMLRGEIPVNKIYEDDYAIAFNDINPQAPVHILVIPKGEYEDFSDFALRAGEKEIAGYIKAVAKVAQDKGLKESGGYRLLMNIGKDSGQEVPHLHTHLFAGKFLGRMICVDDTAKR